jgi:hypothetical protein
MDQPAADIDEPSMAVEYDRRLGPKGNFPQKTEGRRIEMVFPLSAPFCEGLRESLFPTGRALMFGSKKSL